MVLDRALGAILEDNLLIDDLSKVILRLSHHLALTRVLLVITEAAMPMSLVLRLNTFLTAQVAMHLHEHLLSRLCHLSERLLYLSICQLAFRHLREELFLMIGDLDTILLFIEFVPKSL